MAMYTKQIQSLYVAYFGRPADVDGLAYWEKVLTTQNGDTAYITEMFSGTAEYQAQYGRKTYGQVVWSVYKNLFNHEPDLPGLNYWTQGLENGNFTIGNAVATIAAGALTTDRDLFQFRVLGATAFTDSLDTPAERIGYSGDYANAKAKQFIAQIVDADTLEAAIGSLDRVYLVGTPAEINGWM